MHKQKIIVTVGVLVALLPLLGFPSSWESFFQVFAGLVIVGLSVWTTIDKKLTLKARAERRQAHRRAQDRMSQENRETEVVPMTEDEETI